MQTLAASELGSDARAAACCSTTVQLLRGHGPSLAPVASGRAARDQEAVIVGVFAVALTRSRIHMPDAPWPGTAQKIR